MFLRSKKRSYLRKCTSYIAAQQFCSLIRENLTVRSTKGDWVNEFEGRIIIIARCLTLLEIMKILSKIQVIIYPLYKLFNVSFYPCLNYITMNTFQCKS